MVQEKPNQEPDFISLFNKELAMYPQSFGLKKKGIN